MALILLACFSVPSHCFSQRRVGVGYALRVSPAVTRLTVYRRPQVTRRASSVLPVTRRASTGPGTAGQ